MLRQTSKEEEVLDRTAEVAANIAEEGLRYVSDSSPGYTRKRTGTTFSYYDKDGKPITDAAVIRRIKSIGVPPAYESVWICPSPNGHIQATGLDARGRKQYRYHSKWRELRDQDKYEHVIRFAAALPALRDRVAADMKRDGLPREKVLATIVSLLEKTLIRVGNAEYAEMNKSYGLTTMRRKHVAIGRGVLRFEFTGKSGKQWKLRVEDKRIASIVKRRAEIPGHEHFKYLDEDGEPRTVDFCVHQGHHKRGLQRQGFPDLGGDRACGIGADRVQEVRQPGRGQTQRRRRDRERLQATRQHSGHLPQVLCAPGGPERLHVRRSGQDDRSQDRAEIQAPVPQAHARRDHGAGVSPQASRFPEGRRLIRAYQSA